MNRKLSASFAPCPPFLVRWGTGAYRDIPLMVGITGKGEICRLTFARGRLSRSIPSAWEKAWPRTEFIRDQKAIAMVMDKIAAGAKLRLLMVGTAFQCAVWRSLLAIPEGETVTYAELARRSKRPKAVRAAGSACGANPVPILVPCHRVIAGDGSLGGFAGGLAVKRKLLRNEKEEKRD